MDTDRGTSAWQPLLQQSFLEILTTPVSPSLTSVCPVPEGWRLPQLPGDARWAGGTSVEIPPHPSPTRRPVAAQPVETACVPSGSPSRGQREPGRHQVDSLKVKSEASNQFPQNPKLQELTQDEINGLNNSIAIKQILFIMLKIPEKETFRPKPFHWRVLPIFSTIHTRIMQSFQENKEHLHGTHSKLT